MGIRLVHTWRQALIAMALSMSPHLAAHGADDDIHGVLSIGKGRVGKGSDVTLALTITGSGKPESFFLEQPLLPKLKYLDLVTREQRNEAAVRSGKELFTITIFYTLRAKEAGEENIPDLEVKYRKAGERESRTLQVSGVKVLVEQRSRGGRGYGGVVVLAGAGIAAVILIALFYAARRARSHGEIEPREGASVEEPETSLAAVVVLSRMEDAHKLKGEGRWGEYGAEILGAISEYSERGDEPELRELIESLRDLCGKARYARDEDAERNIEASARQAEIFFKKKIRESMK
ncbi:MAG: BatD family protein [Candidatus Aureabacteria bacterium]|nr:BatD family protein [Candidatus Auribacterota bacterium]